MQVIKKQLADLEITDHCEFCFNGQEAVQIAEQILEDAIKESSGNLGEENIAMQPISLVLLDF